MARIPAAVLERLKAEISVERLAQARGVSFTRHGADLIGRCPFHEDRTPSLVVSPAKNLWHCLGACQAGGTVIDWVMHAEGVSFRHAVELLLNDSIPLAAAAPAMRPPKRSSVVKLPSGLERDAEDAELLVQVIEYYHQSLQHSAEALQYLRARGIGAPEAIGTFKLGYANRTLGYRLPGKNRVEGAALRGRLQRLGLLRASGHEHFNGSLVIPVLDAAGHVTEVYGRKINDHLRPGTPKHLYLPGPHRGVWNGAALSASPEIILCEALIDALTFWCAGYRHVTASYGVEGFTADHRAAFQAAGVQRILIAYDRDVAGERAATQLAAELLAAGFDCYRILFPKGMDANAYALKVGPPAKSLGLLIRTAQWLGQGRPKPLTTVPVESADMAPVVLSPLVAAAAKDEIPQLPDGPPEAELVGTAAEHELAVLPAQVIPEGPRALAAAAVTPLGIEHEHVFVFGSRRYRVRGLEKNLAYEVLKVNLLVAAPGLAGDGEVVHVDTLDLYQARARAAFVKQAAVEFGVQEELLKGDLGQLLLALEAEQERLIHAAQAPKASARPALDAPARQAALALLTSPDLIARITADFARCGIVGEGSNALLGYLAVLSRKLDRPLALLLQSSSAAGKSALLDAVLRFVPEEDRVVYSAVTGQSLFYMGEMDLQHRVLAIAEEQGAARASYALKLLQSEGELSIASTSKDPATGKLVTAEYRVSGPVMLALTTTAAEIDEELLNRCLVLSIDEGRAQTQAIQAAQRQRRTLAGLLAKAERAAIRKVHQDAQRLLAPLAVVNPYASRLTFLDDRMRTRRDHEKYLTLIDVIALLHQHQRAIRTVRSAERELAYIEVTLEDIALANALAHEALGRTLDELPPQTRRLLELLCTMVEHACTAQRLRRADYRFSRRMVREATRWGDTQLKIHLARLVELEYLLVHRGGRGQSFEYELLYDGAAEASAAHLNGLIDVEHLRSVQEPARSGPGAESAGVSREAVGASSAAGRVPEAAEIPSVPRVLAVATAATAGPELLPPRESGASYRHRSVAAR
jgi:DNA primase catalytic core